MGMRLISFLSAALLYLALPVHASTPGAALTDAQVRGFIASWPQVSALGEKHDDGKRRPIDRRRPMSSAIEQMRGNKVEAELKNIVSPHGFTSLEQWGDVGDRVMMAYMVLSQPPLSEAKREEQFQQGLKNVEADPKLTPEQRQTIVKNMHKSHARNKATIAAAERDAPAVQPHLAELKRVLPVD